MQIIMLTGQLNNHTAGLIEKIIIEKIGNIETEFLQHIFQWVLGIVPFFKVEM
ncbi:hypothetical protein [uncultured Chryseobacterium sp.]|uniref:hypothetical protein n=1 Tax=uncultured Chryseobacterium sp. TaxID=259322 RepID=UPI0025CEEE03|nr:hypothetical protein [uncultured Chryseobacterium sp.]